MNWDYVMPSFGISKNIAFHISSVLLAGLIIKGCVSSTALIPYKLVHKIVAPECVITTLCIK